MSFYVTYPSTSVSSGPIQFYLDGSPVYVSEDTGTPANSVPLPVVLLGGSGTPVVFNDDYGASSGALRTAAQIGNTTGQADFNAGATGAQTFRVEANQGAANATPWNVAVSNFPAIQPVSGTIAISQATPGTTNGVQVVAALPAGTNLLGKTGIDQTTPGTTNGVVVNSSALPTGASTSANQTNGTQKTQVVDGSGNVQPSGDTAARAIFEKITDGTNTMAVKAASTAPVATDPAAVVAISPNSPSIPTKSPINPNGSYAEITNLTTSAQTFTAPANAVGFVIETPSSVNTVNVRYKIGAAATTTSGMVLEPGRSEAYPNGPAANISVITESGSAQAVTVQWILNQ